MFKDLIDCKLKFSSIQEENEFMEIYEANQEVLNSNLHLVCLPSVTYIKSREWYTEINIGKSKPIVGMDHITRFDNAGLFRLITLEEFKKILEKVRKG